MANQPSTPGQIVSIFGTSSATTPTLVGSHHQQPTVGGSSLSVNANGTSSGLSPGSANSNNTYIMPNSPLKNLAAVDGYRPRVTRTLGNRPACLVNASVTHCGNNHIYAFGGFDQYTDEVYNHVLRLDLTTNQWSLVDNYGDIPGVRMGHTATLYQGDKLLVFGGENEHRAYLSDLIVFDLKTAHWTKPQVNGPVPKGRARHAAVLHEDKLFVVGGITGRDNYVLDDICYLDLKTYTWSRSWRFVARFDHSAYIWGDRVWVFGGLSQDMDKIGELWWLDLKGNPAFESPPLVGTDRNGITARSSISPRPSYALAQSPVVGSSGYAANSRTAQVNPPSFQLKSYAPTAPGAISALKFASGPNNPSQGQGYHFHVYSSGTLLDFQTPAATITSNLCSLSALDLGTLRWQKVAEGHEVFKSGYRWHYCTMNAEGTKAYLLGCPTEPGHSDIGPNGYEEYLSDIMEIDLRRYGFLGNSATPDHRIETRRSVARAMDQPSRGLGSDLAKVFNQPPETGSGTDFVITALAGDMEDDEVMSTSIIRGSSSDGGSDEAWLSADAPTSAPIHVHKIILQARWPHFKRLYNSQMAEFHTKKMHIPEPYTVVKAFLLYLYTDSIHGTLVEDSGAVTGLSDVAGLLVMSNIYGLPHLRLLCVNRLSRELDVDHACVTWYCAGLAGEEWLRKRAAVFCMTHWGRVVRTAGFLRLPRSALVELSQEVDMEGRVVGGEELEFVEGLRGSAGFGDHGPGGSARARKASVSSQQTQMMESELEDEDGMEVG